MLQVYCRNFRSKKLLFPSVSTCNLRSSSFLPTARVFGANNYISFSKARSFITSQLLSGTDSYLFTPCAYRCITHWSIKQTALVSNVSFSYICSLMSGLQRIEKVTQAVVRLDRRSSWNLKKPSRSDKYLRLKRINFIRKPQLRSTECGNQGDEPVSRRAASMFATRLTLAFGITFSYLRSNSFLFLQLLVNAYGFVFDLTISLIIEAKRSLLASLVTFALWRLYLLILYILYYIYYIISKEIWCCLHYCCQNGILC